MEDNKYTTIFGGVSCVELLQIAFIILKLCGVIKWKWVYVLMPFIITMGLSIIATILVIIYIKYDEKNGGDGLC